MPQFTLLLAFGVLGGTGLLIVLGMLNTGRLHIENALDLRRDTAPVKFFLTLAAIGLLSVLLLLVCVITLLLAFGSNDVA